MRILCLILGLCLSVSLTLHASVVQIQVNGSTQNVVKCYEASGKEVSLTLDTFGKATWELTHNNPVYVRVSYNYATFTLWLPTSANVTLAIDGASTPARCLTIEGTAAAVSNYLNTQPYQSTEINDAAAQEVAFLKKTDSLLKVNTDRLNATALPDDFKQMERQRLLYYTYRTLPDFPHYHRRLSGDTTYQPSTRYWALQDKLVSDGAACLDIEEYRTLAYAALIRKAQYTLPTLRGVERLTAFLEEELLPEPLAEYLVYQTQINFLNREKTLSNNPYTALVARYVKREAWQQEIQTLLANFDQLAAGAPSPDFVCTDTAGRTVTLADFRGKYVYIDLWATWCAPCVKEIPHLVRLEETLGHDDFYFVSISCDANRNTWLKRVQRDAMKGVQLHFPPNNDFLTAYKVDGIPRFILLDRAGRIIAADMTRPSDPATLQRLQALVAQ